MSTDQWIAVAAVIFPVLALVLGIRLTRISEADREDRQRAYDRRNKSNEAQRATIAELQEALTELQLGTAMAVMIGNLSKKVNPKGDLLNYDAPWFQDWLRAEQRVYVLSSRIGDDQLKKLAREFAAYKDRVQSKVVVSDPSDLSGLIKLLDEISEEVAKPQERAGILYQDFGPESPEPDKRSIFKRLVIP